MRSVTRLIEQIRRQTENEEFTDFAGIKDQEFIQYINDAQYNLQAQIVHQHPSVFIEEMLIPTVPGQERYDLPVDCFLGNKVTNVEYSASGNEEDFYVLKQSTLKSRTSGVDADPSLYIRLSGQIMLAPQPASGGMLRVNYVRRVRELDTRKAKVSENVSVTSSTTFTIKLDNQNYDTDTDSLKEHDFICVVDKLGRSIVKDIEIRSIDSTSIVCEAHTKQSHELSVIPAGAYIVGGKHTTTHSDLGVEVERYLISYCAWKILKRDSSVDSTEAMQELTIMAQEIVKSYALISDDVQFIPNLNNDDWSI